MATGKAWPQLPPFPEKTKHHGNDYRILKKEKA
jgi:hypothetical protein